MNDHLVVVPYRGTNNRVMAGLYEFRLDRFRIAAASDMGTVKARVTQADTVSGFGLFDGGYDAIFGQRDGWLESSGMYRVLMPRTNDLLRKVQHAMGQAEDEKGRKKITSLWGLDIVARGTIDRSRVTTDELVFSRADQGDWTTVANLILEDVALVRDLVLFEGRYGYLINVNSGTKIGTRFVCVRVPTTYADPASLLQSPLTFNGQPFAPLPYAGMPASADVYTPPQDKE